MSRLLCVDLSSIVHRIWHVSTQNTDPDHTSIQSVARVRSLAQDFDYVAICCDSRRSYRKDISPTYKANRPPTDEALRHQLLVAKDRLEADGFACFEAEGFEADDVIATIVRLSESMQPVPEVVIASADKDLHQLIDERVSQLTLHDNALMTPARVKEKYGIEPHQFRDWLVLVGDSADNIQGVKGIGEKGATLLLQTFVSLYALMKRINEGHVKLGLKPAIHRTLAESTFTMEIDRQLVSLNDQAPIDFQKIYEPRHAKAVAAFPDATLDDQEDNTMSESYDPNTGEVLDSPAPQPEPASAAAPPAPASAAAAEKPAPEKPATEKPAAKAVVQSAPLATSPSEKPAAPVTQIGPSVAKVEPKKDEKKDDKQQVFGADSSSPIVQPVVASLVKVPWTNELEPRSLRDAEKLAKYMHDSKLFSAYGNPQAVLSSILAGRELGIGAMASLRGFHIIDGKPSMSAGLMSALVLRSGLARVFSVTKRSNDSATLRAWRKGEDEVAIDITYSLEDAERAGLIKPGSGWQKNPADMCVARVTAIGARLRFSDVVFGLYTPEELGHEELDEAA